MTDLVKRLRGEWTLMRWEDCLAAADRIEQLEALVTASMERGFKKEEEIVALQLRIGQLEAQLASAYDDAARIADQLASVIVNTSVLSELEIEWWKGKLDGQRQVAAAIRAQRAPVAPEEPPG